MVGRLGRALKHRNYRLYWIGQLVSLTGTWMQSTAQQWLVYRLTGSPLKLGTVAFLAYPGFDEVAHPSLRRSVRVYLPKAAWEVRDYHTTSNPPILHRKDALVSESHPKYKVFRQLTEEEERLGLLSHNDIGFRSGWDALLASRRLVIEGHAIRQAP